MVYRCYFITVLRFYFAYYAKIHYDCSDQIADNVLKMNRPNNFSPFLKT